jgi:hypothetical protein
MKIFSLVLGIALVVVGGLAIHQSRLVDAADQRIADLEARLNERPSQMLTATFPVPSSPAPASSVPQAEPAATRESRPASQPEAAAEIVRRIEELTRLQRSSPEGIARRLETGRMLVRSTNPDVIEAVGLSTEEADRLFDLLAAQQDKSAELFSDLRNAQDPEAARSQLAARLEEIRQSNEAELKELLGGKYTQWKDYEQNRAAWRQRRDLNAVLKAAGSPLTPEQDRALIGALTAEYQNIRNTRQASAAPFQQYAPEVQQRLVQAASAHLSPQQLESYRQMLERAAKQEEAAMGPLIRAAEAAASGTSAPVN